MNKEWSVMWETPEEFMTSYYFGTWPKPEAKPVKPVEEQVIVKRKMPRYGRREGKK